MRHPDGKRTSSNWLRFQKEVDVIDEEAREKNCRIAIAYALVKAETKNDKEFDQVLWKIMPVNRGQVSIFFPADKETSNLRFHLHAPFASTVARDSVRDCAANNQLRNHISSLVVESLSIIRDKGMLSMEALGVLPNVRDNVPEFYEPIRLAIVDAFRNKPLTPTKNGKYAPGASLFRGPAKISTALDDDDMAELTGHIPPFWAGNPPQLHQREDQFLDSLEISRWEWSELSYIMHPNVEEEDRVIQKLIFKKDDKWLQRFYSLLGESMKLHYQIIGLDCSRVVRIDKNGATDHVLPEDAFFSPSEGYEINLPDNVFFVKKSVYENVRSATAKEYAIAFLQSMGVREFNPRTIIELSLIQHNTAAASHKESNYYPKLKQYINYWKSNPDDRELFKEHSFLLGVSSKNRLYWRTPQELAFSSPYEETGLESVVEGHSRDILCRDYAERFNAEELKQFTAFLKAIGVMHELIVVRSTTYLNPNSKDLRRDSYAKRTHTGIDSDFTIQGLERYLKNPATPLSRLIWMCLIKADPMCDKARYRPNQQYPTREGPSQLVCLLKDHSWIPDKLGNVKKPSEISVDDLRSDFPYDDKNGLLTAIGFGEQERKRSSEYLRKDGAAKAAGFDNAEEQEKWRKVKELGVSADDLLFQYSTKPCDAAEYELPERSAGNSGIRQKRLAEEAGNAPGRVVEERTRTVQINKPIVKEEARQYLKDNYTNPDDSMSCQICKGELPFKQRDGSYYFEAVEFFLKTNKFYPQNYLSLCPNHAAMFRLVNDSECNLKSLLLDVVDEVEIPVTLAGDGYSIYFTERHIADLKTVLGVDAPNRVAKSDQSDGKEIRPKSKTANGRSPEYMGIVFPQGLDTWKNAHCYQHGSAWAIGKRDGAVAHFKSKEDASKWWAKFCDYRDISPAPRLKEGKPKPKVTTKKPTQSVEPQLEKCHFCGGKGKIVGGGVCSACRGMGKLIRR
ncbi:MAG: hypothetical protein OQK12_16675 [Motiliproteus sp.]|nr:hypothetical protein [Motiliproteus sp.]MCW9053901.1 hypothetical protein [Motiliproteus sp.]